MINSDSHKIIETYCIRCHSHNATHINNIFPNFNKAMKKTFKCCESKENWIGAQHFKEYSEVLEITNLWDFKKWIFQHKNKTYILGGKGGRDYKYISHLETLTNLIHAFRDNKKKKWHLRAGVWHKFVKFYKKQYLKQYIKDVGIVHHYTGSEPWTIVERIK